MIEVESPLAKAYSLLFKWGREASPEIRAKAAAAVEAERRAAALREWEPQDSYGLFAKLEGRMGES